MTEISAAIAIIASYLLGSIPTSIIIGRLFFGTDIRTKGSGNAGAANAFRVFGWKAGIVVVVVDVAKGAVATLYASRLTVLGGTSTLPTDVAAVLCGVAAIVGHVWTLFARFRGGKGVATAAGMVLALYPPDLAVAVGIFAVVVMATGIVSAGSMSAAVTFPIVVLILSRTGAFPVSPFLFWLTIPLALLILFTHRKNIGRLLRGQENRFPKLMVFRQLADRLRRRT